MFFVGIVGAALVVLLTTIEDIKEFLFPKREDTDDHPTNDDNKGSPVS